MLLHNGTVVGSGYSGRGDGLNNPEMEADKGVGPIPKGHWRIGVWEQSHPHLGSVVAMLTPQDHDAHGRTEFFIHGDNAAGNHTASHGCIIMNRMVRNSVCASGDHDLCVTE